MEAIPPHPDFLLFATQVTPPPLLPFIPLKLIFISGLTSVKLFFIFMAQNPPGLYGGRKVLSRAFRNRFIEVEFLFATETLPQTGPKNIFIKSMPGPYG